MKNLITDIGLRGFKIQKRLNMIEKIFGKGGLGSGYIMFFRKINKDLILLNNGIKIFLETDRPNLNPLVPRDPLTELKLLGGEISISANKQGEKIDILIVLTNILDILEKISYGSCFEKTNCRQEETILVKSKELAQNLLCLINSRNIEDLATELKKLVLDMSHQYTAWSSREIGNQPFVVKEGVAFVPSDETIEKYYFTYLTPDFDEKTEREQNPVNRNKVFYIKKVRIIEFISKLLLSFGLKMHEKGFSFLYDIKIPEQIPVKSPSHQVCQGKIESPERKQNSLK